LHSPLRALPSPFRTPRSALRIRFAALLFLALTATLHAQDPDSDQQAIDQGKESLQSVARFPWYDRATDDVRPIHIVPRNDADSANRSSQWTATDPQPAGGAARAPGFLGPAMQWIGLTVLILLLGLIAYLFATSFLKDEISEGPEQRRVVETTRDVDRVEALPFYVRKPTGDFLAEARRLYEASQFSEAIIYLFSYQLVQLDRHHVIRLAKGKTNRQYVRETRSRPVLYSILEQTTFAFEDAFFGRKTLTREQFEHCWQQLDTFHAELDRASRAAA
jgi:hypothetical protein